MSQLYPYCEQINLHVSGRITKEDANRQESNSKGDSFQTEGPAGCCPGR